VAELRLTTTEATTQICGDLEMKKPKLFTVEIVVKNKTNDFITVSSAVNSDQNSRTAKWCTSADIPLEIGKNIIVARVSALCKDGIVIFRDELIAVARSGN
jgi:hypothetical protein